METLIVERSEGVVTVTLNRPEKKNAMTDTMWRELMAVLGEMAGRTEDRVLVITGAGDGFCSGADLGASTAPSGVGGALARMRLVGQAAMTLHEFPKPTIAAVNGVAVGAGCNLALGCDIVMASDRARFSEIFSKRGLVVDFGGSWLLPRLIGLHRAKELVFLADVIDAAEAERIGLVNHVIPHDEFDGRVAEMAARLVALPPAQLAVSKKLLNQSLALSMSEALDAEATAQALMFNSRDTAEAIFAFLEKRDPVFTGE